VLETEEHDGLKYGHVFFKLDDSWWIQDLDFRGLLADTSARSRNISKN
jgi:hypothetical protein